MPAKDKRWRSDLQHILVHICHLENSALLEVVSLFDCNMKGCLVSLVCSDKLFTKYFHPDKPSKSNVFRALKNNAKLKVRQKNVNERVNN